MAGHNKWSKIKHKKAVTDAKKSKIFSMHAKKIAVESKLAGGDVESPALKTAIQKAKADNMPNDNIDRAVKRGAGGDAATLEPVLYEAYGPGGVALIIEGITDNTNRTTQEVKHLFTKRGLELAAQGAASWAFTKTADGWEPNQTMDISDADLEKLSDLVDALEEHDDIEHVYTNAS